MNESAIRRMLPDQSSGSVHSFGTLRHPSIIDPILSKRVCFYKSGDPQFNGLRMVINNRTFKTFDALLDSLSKKVPLPFGVRNITTPRGVHAVYTLDELEDGKSYICSDSRKVKPINLALARKKLPPWYHARPVSSRRRTVQQARFFPGQNIHRKERAVVRTPKRLLVFRNGDPAVKHTVALNKRTMPTFESIVEYISELMQFHVVKLHMPDGRRVDGLHGLILSSGTVVAAGREPFKPANYNVQKSPAPTMQPTNRMGLKRLKAFNRKKKLLPYNPKLRKFSASSERYIMNRIHESIAESSCDIPTYPTNSIELGSGPLMESVAETEGDACLGDGAARQDCLPAEDDIEKSFRVNQDGSMTVEMKVRLTIKEEETIHWTTTLTRSSVANQLNAACLPESEVEQDIGSLKSDSLGLQSAAASSEISNRYNSEDNNDEEPPSPSNGILTESSNEEDNVKVHMDVEDPKRTPTPEQKQITKRQASVDSVTSLTADGIQEGVAASYSYREQTEHRAITEQYCMVKQTSTKPVPKPRRFGSVDANSVNRRNVSTFKSAGMTEILQIDSGGEEVTETVLHIYEQETCQDNYLANLHAQGVSASGIQFCRPATSGTGHLSSAEFESDYWRPSTASESISIWRAESMSVTSELTLPALKTDKIQAANPQQQQQQLPKPTKVRDKPQQSEIHKDKKVTLKPKVINKRVYRLKSPGKRQKENSAEATEKRRKMKTFSSAGFIKKIYGNTSKSAKTVAKKKQALTQNVGHSSQQSTDKPKYVLENPNIQSTLKEDTNKTGFVERTMLHAAYSEVNQPRGVLTRQTSVHQEKHQEYTYDVNETISLPAFNSSTSVTHEYVENWLEKSRPDPTAYPDEGNKKSEAVTVVQTGNGRCGETENKNSSVFVAQETKHSEESSETQKCQTLRIDREPEMVRVASVKQRIQSFENKSERSPSMRKTSVSQKPAHSHTTTANTENCSSSAQNDKEEMNPLKPPTETSTKPSSSSEEEEKKSNPIKISLQEATPFHTLSMEFPPPPPPAENTELSNTDSYMMDAASVASSPLYRLSSVSSQTSDNHPLSISPTSDKAISPTEHAMEMTTSIQTDIPSTPAEVPLPRSPSIKRAPLVSNLSFDRKMSLRKACLDKYTLSSDAAVETATSSAPINIVGDNVLTDSMCPSEAQLSNRIPDLNYSPSCGTSASPTSSTSEEGASSASISSNEESKPKTTHLTQKEASSPKPVVKKVKLMSSPSVERESLKKKSASELPQNLPKHNRLPDKTVSPNIGQRKHATPNASPAIERKQMSSKPKSQKWPSPYSQSLDIASPPVRNKSGRKLLSRAISSDSPSEGTQGKTAAETKSQETPQLMEPMVELDQTFPEPVDTDQSEDSEVQKESVPERQSVLQPLSTTNQPNMKPVLEEICYSIKSIRQITQNKRPSCLEKSNSLPDFSSHVASTFGSSSKALLAFLSVMTLKEGLTNLNIEEMNANNVSCAEALKMISSLREIASIEDSHKLKASLSNLQQSASKQLLQSWRGFQEFSDKCRSRSTTPNDSQQELVANTGPVKECVTDENVIDEIMDNLDVPEELKEELASLSVGSNVGDETQDEKVNVDVRSIINKFTVVEQPQQPSTDTAKHRPTEQAAKDNRYENGEAHCPPFEEESLVETEDGTQSYLEDIENRGENKQPHGHDEEVSDEEEPDMQGVVSSMKNLQQDSCASEGEEKDVEGNQLKMPSEESTSIPDSEHTLTDESDSELERQNMSSANKDLEQKVSCEQSGSGSDAGEQQSSEEEPEVDNERIEEQGKESDLSNPESVSEEEEEEEEEEKQRSPSYYAELNVRAEEQISSPDSQNKTLSDEEPLDVECAEMSNKDALSNPASPDNSEQEQQSQAGLRELSTGADRRTCDSDMEEVSSEEEQPEVECKELQAIVEEAQESTDEEDHIAHPLHPIKHHEEAVIEETEEDKISSEDEAQQCDQMKSHQSSVEDRRDLIENQDPHHRKDNSGLVKSDNLGKHFRRSADEDSGNDHSSCEEHLEVEQPKVKGQISSSIEEELSYYEKESSSEEEQANMDTYIEESCADYQEASSLETQLDDKRCEKSVEKLKHTVDETISQSIAERVTLLQKQVAEAQKRKNTTQRHVPQRNVPHDSDAEDSAPEMPTSDSAIGTQSALQSSLSFSYDSSSVITTEPEGSRVRSIREMFLAKTATDMQPGQRRFPSPRRAELSDLRAETSASGGYQSQTSSELSSSGEEDTARKSITKGFVRRTIERLYGKKDTNPDEEASERPPSEAKQKKKEHSSIFSPFHIARSKAMSELSYFNSTNALDTLSEATRCVAFNAQVGPGDSVAIDQGRWLLRENTLIRKSVSDPVGINKTFRNAPPSEEMCEDTKEKTPSSPSSTKPEEEDKKASLSRKCTYFALPHASDSDACQDELSTISRGSTHGDSVTDVKDNSEDAKTWAERNGTLPGISDFKMKDNKVHPMVEAPPGGDVVVAQPRRGQGVMERRLQEPDMLDILYDFCGQNCPIL